PQARRIAQAIVRERQTRPLETTADLVQVIEKVKGRGRRGHHPATQVFQALRMAVNQELHHLERFLENGYETLRPQGRMAIISFHSLEDRMVKTKFRQWSRDCLCPPRTLRCQCGWRRNASAAGTNGDYLVSFAGRPHGEDEIPAVESRLSLSAENLAVPMRLES